MPFTLPGFTIIFPQEGDNSYRVFHSFILSPQQDKALGELVQEEKNEKNMRLRFELMNWAQRLPEAFLNEEYLALGYGFSNSGKSTLIRYLLHWVLCGLNKSQGQEDVFKKSGVVPDQMRSIFDEGGEQRAVYPGIFTVSMNKLFTDTGRFVKNDFPPNIIDTACGHSAILNAIKTFPGLIILVRGIMWDGEGDFDDEFAKLRPQHNTNMDPAKFQSQGSNPSFIEQMYANKAYNSKECPFGTKTEGSIEIPHKVLPFAPNFMQREYPPEICAEFLHQGWTPGVIATIIQNTFQSVPQIFVEKIKDCMQVWYTPETRGIDLFLLLVRCSAGLDGRPDLQTFLHSMQDEIKQMALLIPHKKRLAPLSPNWLPLHPKEPNPSFSEKKT